MASPPETELAIDKLRASAPLDTGAVDAFVDAHEIPIVEGVRCTFLHRGEADEVHIAHRVVGLPDRIPLERIEGTDLWFAVVELPEGSRVEYQLQVTMDGRVDEFSDPLNPRRAHNPFGSSSYCAAAGYEVPDWTQHDDDARPGSIEELTLGSRGLARDAHVTLYLPARFRRSARYPLLVVHDGADYLRYAAAKTVLDNLIHRLDVAGVVAAFLHPGDRLEEYPDHEGHARFVAEELVTALGERLPLIDQPRGRCLMGSSFGGVATLSTASRHPGVFGSLIVQSGSFVFTDIGFDHGGGPVFDPVVEFMNRYRASPTRVADRVHLSCGVYEPLITPNRALVPVLRGTGMEVRYVEARDGHNWENWRDRLRDALAWVFPGPQKYVYE
jgi:enterochelin esterase family protein